MRKLSFIAIITAFAAAGTAPAASAAQPIVHGCTGDSISAAAHAIAPWGQFVSQLARTGEISDDVHALQAGGLTDDDFPNSCN
jgi:hypothetical protein